jgi:hypothetical protein
MAVGNIDGVLVIEVSLNLGIKIFEKIAVTENNLLFLFPFPLLVN